jgi:hypothetical protein
MVEHFEALVLIGRPAAGKSAVVNYLARLEPARRLERFKIATPEVFSDLPYLWQTLENDDIRTRFGKSRLHSTEEYVLKDPWFWSFLIERLGTDCRKRLLLDADWFASHTAIVKFARGGDNAYGEAFGYLCDAVLSRAAILYVDIPHEVSVQRCHARWPQPPYAMLTRPVPTERLDQYFRTDDWARLSTGQPDGYIQIKSYQVPFAVLSDDPQVTGSPETLGPALDEAIHRLWKRLRSR